MTKKQYRFEIFTPETAALTRQDWLTEATEGLAFVPEVGRLFDWVNTHQVISDLDAVAYGVFEGTSKTAIGICEVTIQRKTIRSKWVKMLRLHLLPSVDSRLQDGDSDKAMDVFVESMQGSIALQMAHSANTLKVYGRTNEQLNFLRALLERLKPVIEGKPVKASIEGRFLSIVIS